MTNLLIKLFINPENGDAPAKNRPAYSTLAAVTGIVCNIVLFAAKYIIGTAASSISIVSDGFNNLSDSAGCIVTLIGCKMAAKPADRDHPYGHERAEYLTSFFLSMMIVGVGIELLIESGEKIFSPEKVTVTLPFAAAMGISIAVKLWMGKFYGRIGDIISSPALKASARDSRNDVIATSAALAGAVFSAFSKLPGDGICGVLVSLFVLKSGYDLFKDTTDDILGKPADSGVLEDIRKIILSRERILGVHDIMVHSYGPSKKIASCHAEVRSDERLKEIHEVIDGVEREIFDKLGISMTIHTDPVDVDNRREQQCRAYMRSALKAVDERLHIHDFRIALLRNEHMTADISHAHEHNEDGSEHMIFDLAVPYEFPISDEELREKIKEAAKSYSEKYGDKLGVTVTFDRE
ncbi:MAG: cation diffusion facilitator family transporter [Ruminococcus sp.]|nr:cation diffusion facilitator family transporter [Ruminococcus sp.]